MYFFSTVNAITLVKKNAQFEDIGPDEESEL